MLGVKGERYVYLCYSVACNSRMKLKSEMKNPRTSKVTHFYPCHVHLPMLGYLVGSAPSAPFPNIYCCHPWWTWPQALRACRLGSMGSFPSLQGPPYHLSIIHCYITFSVIHFQIYPTCIHPWRASHISWNASDVLDVIYILMHFIFNAIFNPFPTGSHTYMAASWLSCTKRRICTAAPLRALAGTRMHAMRVATRSRAREPELGFLCKHIIPCSDRWGERSCVPPK